MKHAPTPFARTIILFALFSGILAAVCTIWYLFAGSSLLLSLAITFCTFFYHFAMRLLVGIAVPTITNPDCRWFRPRVFEPKLYAILKIRRLKKRAPTYDPGLFSLEQCSVAQLLQNSCRAELIHEIIMVLSFLPVFAIGRFGAPLVFWSTSVLASLFDSLFVMIQRYNRPRLVRISEKERRKHG